MRLELFQGLNLSQGLDCFYALRLEFKAYICLYTKILFKAVSLPACRYVWAVCLCMPHLQPNTDLQPDNHSQAGSPCKQTVTRRQAHHTNRQSLCRLTHAAKHSPCEQTVTRRQAHPPCRHASKHTHSQVLTNTLTRTHKL